MLKLKSYLITSAFMLLTACTPGGENSTLVEISDLVGLWNSSEKQGAKTDVIYTRITSDGSIIEYDFDGDEVDNGLACYQIYSGSVKSLGKNRFLVSADMHSNKQFELELELLDAGHALKIYFIDAQNPATTLKSQIWTRVADANMLEDEPSCQKSN